MLCDINNPDRYKYISSMWRLPCGYTLSMEARRGIFLHPY
jgi:hypothetical protein